MNILFVTAVLPYPPESGGQIRTYNLLRHLSKRHAITLLSFIRNPDELNHKKEFGFLSDVHMVLRGRAWRARYISRAVTGRYPFLMATYQHSVMRTLIADLSRGADLIHLEPFYVWPSVPRTGLPVVVSEHNIEYGVYSAYVSRFSVPFLKPMLYWDVAKLRYWERQVWRQADALTAVSDADAEVMREASGKPVTVVSNGVDTAVFSPGQGRSRKEPAFLFVGNFRWLPNREAATALLDVVWPALRSAFPASTLTVAGRDMPVSFMRKAKAAGVTALTNVPDIAGVYRSADFLIAPHAIAGGTKFKMLEAMATGLAVVSTPDGVSGLNMTAGRQYLEASTPAEFVAAVTEAWKRPALRAALAKRSREFVQNEYGWSRIAQSLDRVWESTHEKHA